MKLDSTTIQSKLACFNENDIHLTFSKAEMEMLISVSFFENS